MTYRRDLLVAAIVLAILGPASAHQVNLSTARVTLNGDRTVNVEVGLKGSDADRLANTKVFDAQRDQVDPALVAASAGPIIAYFNAHVDVSDLSGKGCVPSTAALVTDGDGVVFRNSYSCGEVTGDIVYRSTVLTATDRPPVRWC